VALPVDPRIEAYLAGGRGLVSTGNAQRRQMSILAALGLTDSGLLERSGSVLQGTQGAGFAEAPELMNESYAAQQGPEGRAFRQAFQSIDSAAAQRGAAYGSARDNAQSGARSALLQQLAASLRQFDAQQARSITDQMAPLGELGGNIAQIRWEQGREAAAAPPAPAGPSAAFQAAMTPVTGQPNIEKMIVKKPTTKGTGREPLKRAPVTRPRVRR